jgi:hypothetical protein
MRTWERDDPDLGRPIAAPLDWCAQLLGVDLAAVRKAAAKVEPYVRADGTKIWSLMQLARPTTWGTTAEWRFGGIKRRGRSRNFPS